MNSEWARTFLTVVATGNFVRAAERLHVTQSTVSARIQSLERALECTLFVRNKSGASLTPAGRNFVKHADTLVRTTQQARQDARIAHGHEGVLTVGARFALWVGLLMEWLPRMSVQSPRVSLRAEIDSDDGLMNRLVDGTLDIGVMYTPHSRPGLTIEPLLEEVLVLVSREPSNGGLPGDGYVLVDWGPEFAAKHGMHFPDFGSPALVVGIAWLGLQTLLTQGGAGYFPLRLVRDYVNAGELHLVPSGPRFTLQAYMVYPTRNNSALLGPALVAMREVAAELPTS